jgi:hydroxymethylglutaryl-CoA reductase
MIENVVGLHALPLGIAQNFVVNGREVLVPMAIEEPSVVAGASFMARLARGRRLYAPHHGARDDRADADLLAGKPGCGAPLLLEHAGSCWKRRARLTRCWPLGRRAARPGSAPV